MPSTEEMADVVRAYTEAHSAGDIDAIAALFAEDAVVADPVHQPAHHGRDAIRAFFASTHEIADSLHLSATGPVRAVDRFAAVPLRAVSSFGDSKVAVDIIDVFTFGDDGLIVDMKAYWDPASISPVE
jgi:steroid delta-isomerase